MNAPVRMHNLIRLLQSGYDHMGLSLDLYGYMDDDGYNVRVACVPNTEVSVCADQDLLSFMSAYLDDHLPSAEELRATSIQQQRLDQHDPDLRSWITH